MFDVFLGGPWEKHCQIPYKTLLKVGLPKASFYDPESVGLDWFDRNLDALRRSQVMVVFVPSFPMPGVGPEVGIYYEHRVLMGRQPHLVVIWPDDVAPKWGQEVLGRMGRIVGTVSEAVRAVAGILAGGGHDTAAALVADGVQGYDLEIPE